MTALVLWDGDQRAAWLDSGGTLREGTLAQAAHQHPGAGLRVALAHPELAVYALRLPRLAPAARERAIAHALEDECPQDPARLTRRAGPRGRDGLTLAAVCPHARLAQWQAQLDQAGAGAGVGVGALHPAPALLAPDQALTWQALTLGRDARGAWCLEQGVAHGLAPGVDTPPPRLDAAGLRALASPAVLAAAPDLRTAPAPTRAARAWWPAIALTGAAFAVLAGGAGLEHMRLQRTLAQLDAQVHARFARLLPGIPPGADPDAQITSALRARAAPTASVLGVLDRAAPALAGRRLTALRYTHPLATVQLELPDLAALDALAGDLRARGLEVRVVQASAQGGRVPATLELRAP